ncbi:hypothetical protein CRG98_032495 [Punica granatum]|uniref:Uncharacterized protein n=1 Tax=Punica granatum TaxID=22663 RepID=A0A2I0ISV3_PUNGR|nr:hypothetical protein CRG98_032495 [Punica granatum]
MDHRPSCPGQPNEEIARADIRHIREKIDIHSTLHAPWERVDGRPGNCVSGSTATLRPYPTPTVGRSVKELFPTRSNISPTKDYSPTGLTRQQLPRVRLFCRRITGNDQSDVHFG